MGNPPVSSIGVGDSAQFANPTGATVRPVYVERRPPMWAVGETDVEALSLANSVATTFFAVGSFCLGFAANIFVSYVGAEKLTDVGTFMLHQGTVCAIIAAIACFIIGGMIQKKRGSLWKRIKEESRQVMPQ